MKNGFSFLGMLIALIIIGGLLAWMLPQYTRVVQQQHKTQMQLLEQTRNLEKQLQRHQQLQERQLNQLANPQRPVKPVQKKRFK